VNGRPHTALRAILELAEAGYFADFEVIDEATAAGVAANDAAGTLGFAVDLGLVDRRGPVRLTSYGREVLASADVLDDLASRIERPALQTPIVDDGIELPATLSDWREFRRANPAAAAAVARGLLASSAEVYFRVRAGSDTVFASRFLRRIGEHPDPRFIRRAPAVLVRIAEGCVQWRGCGDIVGVLLGLHVTRAEGRQHVSGEIAWQLVEEGWHPSPPQPIPEIEQRLGRHAVWFRAGLELAQRSDTSSIGEPTPAASDASESRQP
jgi:hypothetical protein